MARQHAKTARKGIAGVVIAGLVGAAAVVAGAAAPASAADFTLTIDSDGGDTEPQHYGSGWIYGLTENGQLPDKSLLEPVGFNYNRAGGAQLDQNGGWRGGTYERRFAATLAQYKTVKSLGGRFVLLPHDLYGIDGIGGVGASVPGNNGDWADYDEFLDKLISDIKANNMQVEWDIWNEPDYPIFWPEPRTNPARFQQYLDLWERTYNRLRTELPDAKIVGPSTNEGPDERDSWWRGYLDFVAEKNVVPDIFSWHEIEGRYNAHDPLTSKQSLQKMLADRGIIKDVEFQVNEYAAPSQQYPAMSAWYISRLERSDIHGLRSHWGSAQNLHNDAAQLLYHEGTEYSTRGEFQTYKAYASQEGTVLPVDTTSRDVDAYATRSDDGDTLTTLIGSYNRQGEVALVTEQGGPVQPNADVRVIVEKVIEGNGRENRGPTFVSDARAKVGADGRLTTNVDLENSRDAYYVTIKSLDETSSLDGRVLFDESLGGVRAGTTAKVTTGYSNAGEQSQTDVTVKLVLPDGWTAARTEQTLGTVAPGERRDVEWEVSAPSSEVSKQRVVEAVATWNQAAQSLSSNVWTSYSVPCVVGGVCESEEGEFVNGYLEANHAGFTGRGFIAGMLGQGARSSLPFAVDRAGDYTATIRYAAGPDGPSATVDRTMTLTVGDTVKQITFPRTETWAAWNTVEVPVSLPAGVSTLVLSTEAGDTAWVNLDSVTLNGGPVVDETVTATVASDAPLSSTGWYTKPAAVTLKTDDDSSSIQYRIDGGDWAAYTAPVSVSDGSHKVGYRLVKGETAVEGSDGEVAVKVDTQAPAATAKTTPASGEGTSSSPVRVVFSATDVTSGVGSVEYRTGTGAWAPAPADGVELKEPGTFTLAYRATDVAGNRSAENEVRVTIQSGSQQKPAVIAIDQPTVAAGGTLALVGERFGAGEKLRVEVRSITGLTAQATADQNGRFSTRLTVPAGTAAGDYRVVVTRADGSSLELPITVTAAATTPAGKLASTGQELPVGGAAIALLVLLAGAAMVSARRRSSAS